MQFVDISEIPPVDPTPFTEFQQFFGVYDHVVFLILFYLIAITIIITCIYYNTWIIKKFIALFRKKF